MDNVSKNQMDTVLEGLTFLLQTCKKTGLASQDVKDVLFLALSTQVSMHTFTEGYHIHNATEPQPDPKANFH